MTEPDETTTRRGMLASLGGAGLGVAGATLLGCGSDETEQADAATPSCTLVKEQTEGPYYVDLNRVRRNVTEGRPGLRLDLRIKIVNAETCKAMRNAAVEIWHCDALGKYSGFAQEGTAGKTFMRGIQRTDKNGVAVFRTIYPGWYQGRALHIHLKAFTGGRVSSSKFIGGDEQHTGQLFFKESVTDRVAKLSPYNRRDVTRTRISQDTIYQSQGGSLVHLTRRSKKSFRAGLTARVTMAIDAG